MLNHWSFSFNVNVSLFSYFISGKTLMLRTFGTCRKCTLNRISVSRNMFPEVTKFRTLVRALGRKNILLEQLPAFFGINQCAQGKHVHTSASTTLYQRPKRDLEIDLPQLKVPDIPKHELLTFRGMETDFPCLTRK